MRFETPREKKLVYEMTIPIRWGDMDAMGHLNNASYFRYFETARIDWLCAIGASPAPSGEGPVLVNACCNFIRQVEYPGTVRVKQYVSNVGRSSFDTWLTLERTDAPGVVHADGGATVVWVNYREQRSMPLPDWMRALLAP